MRTKLLRKNIMIAKVRRKRMMTMKKNPLNLKSLVNLREKLKFNNDFL